MPVSMLFSSKYIYCHELHSTDHLSPIRALADFYGEIQVDRHAHETVGTFGIGDNNVVRWDVPTQDSSFFE